MKGVTNKDSAWMSKVIRGQEAIVPEFGLGRVMDFGRDMGGTGYHFDYITVRFFADWGNPKTFAAEAVSLIDPTGLILKPYKAKEPVKKAHGSKYSDKSAGKKPTPTQTRPCNHTMTRNGGQVVTKNLE